MLNYDLINDNFETIAPISLDSVNFENWEADINTPYSLEGFFSIDSGEVYDLIKTGKYGVMLNTEELNIPFFPEKSSIQENIDGQLEVKFYSSSFNLKYSKPALQAKPFSGSFSSFLSSLDSSYNWVLSDDFDYNDIVDTGSNLEVLTKACLKNSLVWREENFESGLPTIRVFRSSQLEEEYQATNQVLASPFNSNQFFIKDLNIYSNGDYISYLSTLILTGVGTNANARLEFTNLNADYIDSNYPIILIDGDQYIANSQILNLELKPHYKTYTFQSANIDDFFDPSALEKSAYLNGVKELKKNESLYYSFDFEINKLILPGNFINIDYFKEVKTKSGKVKEVFNIKKRLVLRNLKQDDLSKFV